MTCCSRFDAMFSMREFASTVDFLPSILYRAVVEVDIAFMAQSSLSETPPFLTVFCSKGAKTLEQHPVTKIIFEIVVINDLPASVGTATFVSLIFGPRISEVSPSIFVSRLNIFPQIEDTST